MHNIYCSCTRLYAFWFTCSIKMKIFRGKIQQRPFLNFKTDKLLITCNCFKTFQWNFMIIEAIGNALMLLLWFIEMEHKKFLLSFKLFCFATLFMHSLLRVERSTFYLLYSRVEDTRRHHILMLFMTNNTSEKWHRNKSKTTLTSYDVKLFLSSFLKELFCFMV